MRSRRTTRGSESVTQTIFPAETEDHLDASQSRWHDDGHIRGRRVANAARPLTSETVFLFIRPRLVA